MGHLLPMSTLMPTLRPGRPCWRGRNRAHLGIVRQRCTMRRVQPVDRMSKLAAGTASRWENASSEMRISRRIAISAICPASPGRPGQVAADLRDVDRLVAAFARVRTAVQDGRGSRIAATVYRATSTRCRDDRQVQLIDSVIAPLVRAGVVACYKAATAPWTAAAASSPRCNRSCSIASNRSWNWARITRTSP